MQPRKPIQELSYASSDEDSVNDNPSNHCPVEENFPSNKQPPTGRNNLAVELEVPSSPKKTKRRDKIKLWCCFFPRYSTEVNLAILIAFLAFVVGLIVITFLLTRISRKGQKPSTSFPSNITIGVFYYPWYTGNFQKTLREQLGQAPALGDYHSSHADVIAQHLAWSQQANIGLWIASWWGEGTLTDNIIQNSIFNHTKLGHHKIALFYETKGRIKKEDNYSTDLVMGDVQYMCQQYFDNPNYFRIQGRPVLFIYLTRMLEALGILDSVVKLMRAAPCNHQVFLIGDQAFGGPPSRKRPYQPFELLDAVANYDVYGSMTPHGYAGLQGVDKYYAQQFQWRSLAAKQNCGYVPSLSAGYNDVAVRPQMNHQPLSRRLTQDSADGSLFQAGLIQAIRLVDPNIESVLTITSFNEWFEDTQIEPVVGKSTTIPTTLTTGLEYDAYGELYLDILRNITSNLTSAFAMP